MENISNILKQAPSFDGDIFTEGASHNYWVISNHEGIPRWIFPKDPQVGLAVLNQWHPFNPTSRLKWSALRLAYKFGFLNKVRGVQAVSLKKTDWLEGLCHPVFYIGTPSRTRKAIIFLFRPDEASPCSVLKIPLAENAANNILHEAEMLLKLSAWKPGICPDIQKVMPEHGQSRQSVIQGHTAGFHLTREHFQLLAELRLKGAFTSLKQESSKLYEEIRHIPPQGHEQTILSKVHEILQDDTQLPIFRQHGDFSPWNVIVGCKGFHLIDWERSKMEGLPLLDLFHFLAMQRLIRNKPPIFNFVHHRATQYYLDNIGYTLPEKVVKKILLYYFLEQWRIACTEGTVDSRSEALKSLITCQESVS